jgi:hypothetical protein
MCVGVAPFVFSQQSQDNAQPNRILSGEALFKDRQVIEEHLLHKKYFESLQSRPAETPFGTNGSFSLLGRWAWGPCRAVELTGHYCLVGQGYVYQVFDISNPSAPTVVYDTTLSQEITHIEIRDSTLFIVLSNTVLFCDASSLFPLVERGRLDPRSGYQQDMAVSDTVLFLMVDWVGVLAFSIADYSHPYFLASYLWANEFGVRAIASKGPFVYYAPGGYGEFLHILEYVTDSSSFRQYLGILGSSVTPASAVKIYDSLLVVGWGLGEVTLYSITDPSNPQLLGSLQIGSEVWVIAKKDQRLYCSTLDSGLVVIDISVPSNPVLTAKGQSAGSLATSLAIKDSILAASGSGLKLYSLSSPDLLQDRFYYPTGGDVWAIRMRGHMGFVAAGTAGLWSVDFSDPAHPRPVQNLGVGQAGKVALSRSLACYLTAPAAPTPAQLVIAAASDNGSLTFMSTTDFGYDYGQSIATTDSTAFIGFQDSVVAYRISDPLHPQRLWSWSLHNQATNQISVAGHYLYVAQRGGYDNGGLRILDVSTPDTPRVVASLLKNVFGVDATDSLAIAIADTGLCVIDVSDPLLPSVIGVATVVASVPILQAGRFAYVFGNGIIQVFDINIPTRPTNVGSLSTTETGNIYDIAAEGNNLFLAAPFTGVWVLKNNLITGIHESPREYPLGYQLHQNYPNPFNPTTVIKGRWAVTSEVKLVVYDILGRDVATLASGRFPAGEYSFVFDAKGLASGVYFYRLTAGSFTAVQKMILVR